MSVQQANATVLPFPRTDPDPEPVHAPPMVKRVPVWLVAVVTAVFVVTAGLGIRSLRVNEPAETSYGIIYPPVCAWEPTGGVPTCPAPPTR